MHNTVETVWAVCFKDVCKTDEVNVMSDVPQTASINVTEHPNASRPRNGHRGDRNRGTVYLHVFKPLGHTCLDFSVRMSRALNVNSLQSGAILNVPANSAATHFTWWRIVSFFFHRVSLCYNSYYDKKAVWDIWEKHCPERELMVCNFRCRTIVAF